MRDLAWLFPSKDVTAIECERTQGYRIRCLERWRRQESTVVGLLGLANISSADLGSVNVNVSVLSQLSVNMDIVTAIGSAKDALLKTAGSVESMFSALLKTPQETATPDHESLRPHLLPISL